MVTGTGSGLTLNTLTGKFDADVTSVYSDTLTITACGRSSTLTIDCTTSPTLTVEVSIPAEHIPKSISFVLTKRNSQKLVLVEVSIEHRIISFVQKVCLRLNYKNNKKNGNMKVYSNRGKLISHVVYKNGVKIKDVLKKIDYKYSTLK